MSDETKAPVQHYRQLLVWQKAMDLADLTYTFCVGFPKDEMYGLSSQMKRAAVSLPSNIAEGAARQHTGEFLHFISIAKGSLAELETQALLAEKRKFLDEVQLNELLNRSDEISRMMTGLQRSLRAKKVA